MNIHREKTEKNHTEKKVSDSKIQFITYKKIEEIKSAKKKSYNKTSHDIPGFLH